MSVRDCWPKHVVIRTRVLTLDEKIVAAEKQVRYSIRLLNSLLAQKNPGEGS